ncbi:MAG: hypothetical protein COC19_07355 [SAR86 cluster bacterium]|uniref:Uncharacterized protein n=1 Tax=SAR86 cluster bacterium TaxID=2030880 RepID=A0A2A4MH43_9GAMM|nr:MAG: hypothetical protein COC19_07355 [SAR86 cluster bacterium]
MTKFTSAFIIILFSSTAVADNSTERLINNIGQILHIAYEVQNQTHRPVNRTVVTPHRKVETSRGYRGDARGEQRANHAGYDNFNRRQQGHGGHREFTYTSEAIRGGSSRRTRIIENPYPHRVVTGITLNGISNREVHVRDVIAYPGRNRISHTGYSLSNFDSQAYLHVNQVIDHISVKAKRKQYFTVTFHYR